MSVTAKQLAVASTHKEDIARLVQEHIRGIDDVLIKKPRTWGRNCVTYDLPVNPPIHGLDKYNSQLLLYNAIIQSLEQRGFEVRILLETQRTTLYIAWVTELSAEEAAAMRAQIAAKRITRAAADQFFAVNTLPAPENASTAIQPKFKVTEKGRTIKPRDGVVSTLAATEATPAAIETAAAATTSRAETAIIQGAT